MTAIPPKQRPPAKVQHPLSGSTLGNWITLLIQNGGVSWPYLPRALGTTGMILANAPIRLAEKLRYGRRIKQTQIAEPPVFILGHWRSGTTHLHRLMVQDENWGYVSSLQAFVPEGFLTLQKILASNLNSFWPEQRLMDNVSYSPDVPEEEDYSLSNVSGFSFYCCWYFPQRMEKIYRHAVLMEDLSEAERQQWQKHYLKILKKATFWSDNKRLVVKNPSSTGRIAELLKLFPDAKFIHIYRNPYDVYTSTMKFYKKMLPHYALQTVYEADIEENIFSFYQQLMQTFADTVDLIPVENFVEIRYEDLEQHPLLCLEKIYRQLQLSGFDTAKSRFEDYVQAQAGYRKNQYALDDETRARIHDRWQAAIARWERIPIVEQAPLHLP
ncbi:MAG: sulfotransferase [Cyanobacteria bacterium P01_F01_bin.150]